MRLVLAEVPDCYLKIRSGEKHSMSSITRLVVECLRKFGRVHLGYLREMPNQEVKYSSGAQYMLVSFGIASNNQSWLQEIFC